MRTLTPEEVASRILAERGICTDKKKEALFLKRQAAARIKIAEIKERKAIEDM